MARLVWDNETERKYTTGVSKGVFFDDSGKGHAWSGLISVTEKPQTNEPTAIYNSLGQKYDQYGNVAEKKHGLACYTYPEAMDEFLGYEYLEDVGFSVDERPPKKFHMAYRVELGNGLYEIHVLLNQIATFGETNRATWSNSPSLSTITMNLTGASDPRYGTSHIVLDSRLPVTESAETILFGDKFNDSNINDFLEAEPTWETVAVNYAPVIEPDYENMVWLGKDNLFVNGSLTDSTNGSWDDLPPRIIIDGVRAARQNYGWATKYLVSVSEGTYVYSMYVKDPENQGGQSIRLIFAFRDVDGVQLATSTSYTRAIPVDSGWSRYSFTIMAPEGASTMHGYLLNGNSADGNSALLITGVHLEKGAVMTPWKPSPLDNVQTPLAIDPYPDNYKPGVKKLSTALNTTNRTAWIFYDEIYNGLGMSGRNDTDDRNGYTTVTASQIQAGASVKESHTAYARSFVGDVSNGLAGRIAIQQPQRYSTPLLEAGMHEYSIPANEYLNHPIIIFNYGAGYNAYELTFTNLFITLSGYEGEFFDVNTTPPNKGTKYVRVETATHDYTLKQELRLRSKSRVRIYDQTSYDYWLEADDSQLIRQNETFTFSGPQAEITGGTFTIDDEILGSEGF